MFQRFSKIVHGTSPIGNIEGIWGYLATNGKWFLLNAQTTDARYYPSIRPSNIGDISLTGTLGRHELECFVKSLLQYAQAQQDDNWTPFRADADNQEALDFLVSCGWLTRENEQYHYTIGLVLLMLSRSHK